MTLYLYPPPKKGAQLYPRQWAPFPTLHTSPMDAVEVLYPTSTQGL
jgi:hypothetical protein